mgnify:CR=1 FL=1
MIYYRKRIHQNLVSRFTLGEPAMANPPLRFCLNWSLLLPSPSSAGGGDGGRPGGCTQGSPSLFTGALMNLASFLWDRAHQGFSRLQAPNHHRRRHHHHHDASAEVVVVAGDSEKKKKKKQPLLTWQEQGAAEQRALALALSSQKPATILEFYSPNCTLCRSLLPSILHVESENSSWLNVVMADVENKLWLPEVSPYLWAFPYIYCLLVSDFLHSEKTGIFSFKISISSFCMSI